MFTMQFKLTLLLLVLIGLFGFLFYFIYHQEQKIALLNQEISAKPKFIKVLVTPTITLTATPTATLKPKQILPTK